MGVLTETYPLAEGIDIPKVGFGTWQIPSGDTAYRAVSTALAAGYRHIDTAYAYGNESDVGRAVRDSGLPRDQIFVTSKLPAQIKTYDGAREYLARSVDNLGLGHIDLYLIHAPWPWSRIGERDDAGNLEAWRALQEGKADGALRAIGVSNFDVHDLQNILDHSETVPAANQIQYYIGFTQPKIASFSREHDILVEAYSPLATGGLLDNGQLRAIADAHGVGVAQVALRYVLEKGALPLPKATSADHIRANAALDFALTEDEVRALDALPDAAPGSTHNPTQG